MENYEEQKPVRFPLAVNTTPRSGDLDKDCLLQNCYIDGSKMGTRYAVKRPGFVVGTEAVTTGTNRGIWYQNGIFYYIDDGGFLLTGTLPTIPGSPEARYVTSTKDFPIEGYPNAKVSYFNRFLSEFEIGSYFTGTFNTAGDELKIGTDITLSNDPADTQILGIVNSSGPGVPINPKPIRNILYETLITKASFTVSGQAIPPMGEQQFGVDFFIDTVKVLTFGLGTSSSSQGCFIQYPSGIPSAVAYGLYNGDWTVTQIETTLNLYFNGVLTLQIASPLERGQSFTSASFWENGKFDGAITNLIVY